MSLKEEAVAAKINERLKGPYGELYRKLASNGDPLTDHRMRSEAEEAINAMTNVELIELLDRLLQSKA